MAFMAERSQSNNLNSDKINSFTITALMPELPTPRKHWTQKNSDRMKDANAASAGGSIKKGLCAYIVRSAYITVELIIKSARNDRKCNLHACSMIRNVHFNMTKIRRKQHLSIQKKGSISFCSPFFAEFFNAMNVRAHSHHQIPLRNGVFFVTPGFRTAFKIAQEIAENVENEKDKQNIFIR